MYACGVNIFSLGVLYMYQLLQIVYPYQRRIQKFLPGGRQTNPTDQNKTDNLLLLFFVLNL